MADSFTGNVSALLQRDTYQNLTSRDFFAADIKWAVFNKNAFMRVLGVEGFGIEGMENLESMTSAKPTGKMIRMDSGVTGISGSVFATAGTSFHVGRLGSFTPELVEGGNEWKYSWHRLANFQYIPDVDVQDNGNGNINIKIQKMEGMKQAYVRDINFAILGHASAPDTGVLGPSVVDSDLPNLISVTQTSALTPGNISAGETFWKNGIEQITSVGGGGEFDRPLILRRKLLKRMNTQMTFAEATGPQDYLLLGTQGAHQYYDRLQYADSVTTGKGDLGVSSRYDAAGVQAHAFNGAPMIWDPAVTVPVGATAGTESIYGIHIPSFALALRTEENFKLSGSGDDAWELPREHDQQRTLVASILTRYTPMVSARRPHWVAYDIPANTD